MKESIIIKNLGPLQDIIIEDIKPLSILIGSSGSGKSLLMKTISMMRYIYKRVNIRSYLINSGLKRSPFRLRFESMLHDDMDFYLKQSNVTVIYKVEFSSGRNYTVEYSEGTIKVSRRRPGFRQRIMGFRDTQCDTAVDSKSGKRSWFFRFLLHRNT